MREITYKLFCATGCLRNSNHSTRWNERDKRMTYWTKAQGVVLYQNDTPAGPIKD